MAGKSKDSIEFEYKSDVLLTIYNILLDKFGQMNWWPAKSDFEVIIGAILTQNTSWKNAEKALNNLNTHNLLSFKAIYEIDLDLLKLYIKPSGYYNQKAIKIKEFINFAKREYNFSLELMKKEDAFAMREKLLGIFGIGKETADSILLYAFKKPVFVIDAYTRRILERHNIIKGALKEKYEKLQRLFMANIMPDEANVKVYNEYHALIVMAGKMFCKRTPLCGDCPLKEL
ncbi:MAG: hypothetical protein M1458_04035 [Deltaproteobacteria bacterium]|nr:hypothetical protein [Deltaproteobacteria bacterium]